MTLKENIQCIIEDEINYSEIDKEDGTILIGWDAITERAHEEVYNFLKEQITDAEDYDWLYKISELVSFNEACRIIEEIKDSKWMDDVQSDYLSDAYDAYLIQKDPYAYYGVARY